MTGTGLIIEKLTQKSSVKLTILTSVNLPEKYVQSD